MGGGRGGGGGFGEGGRSEFLEKTKAAREERQARESYYFSFSQNAETFHFHTVPLRLKSVSIERTHAGGEGSR